MHFFLECNVEKRCEFHFARVIIESKRVAYGLWRSLVHTLFFKEFLPNQLKTVKTFFDFFPTLVSKLTNAVVLLNHCALEYVQCSDTT